MQDPKPEQQVRLPEEKPVVGVRIPATHRAPEISESFVKKIRPVGISPQDLTLIAKHDKWLNKLKATEQELKSTPLPTKSEIEAAWREVVRAYWRWMHLSLAKQERRERLENVRVVIKKRLIELQKKATWQKVHHLRQKMGRKFLSKEMSSAASAASLRPRTAAEPSTMPKAISQLPPERLASQRTPYVSGAEKTSNCEPSGSGAQPT
ncbi:MAG: hypothetical protein KIT44_13575 [Opitutaceae bacterium]|nr:hypothetical protein [Opitutaceae bacterium]